MADELHEGWYGPYEEDEDEKAAADPESKPAATPVVEVELVDDKPDIKNS